MALTAAVVNEAITKVLQSGQSYTLPDGTSVTRANLDTMIKLRNELSQAELQVTNSTGMYVPVQFRRPG